MAWSVNRTKPLTSASRPLDPSGPKRSGNVGAFVPGEGCVARLTSTNPMTRESRATCTVRPTLGLAAVLAVILLSSFPTDAQEAPAGTVLDPEAFAAEGLEVPPPEIQDVLAALQSDPTTGRTKLTEYLEPGLGDPNAVADRAIGLVRRLRGDPVETLAIAGVIAEVASEGFFARPVVRAVVDPAFTLPKTIAGWDLGPPDAPKVAGFQAMADNDPRLAGDGLRGLRRPGPEGLTTDGVLGVRRIALEVPDGAYRVMLVTDDLSRTAAIPEPLGAVVVVNGRRHAIVDPRPPYWIGFGAFSDATVPPAPEPAGGVTAGVLTLDVDILGGALDIALPFDEGKPTFVAAVVVEPAAGPTTFAMSAETRETLDNLLIAGREAESRLASAIADLLAGIATAAGVEERVALLQLADLELAVEDLLSVSPE